MITELTPEQKAYLPVFRDAYLDAAIGGHPTDRDELEQAVGDAYREIRKGKPALVVVDSPRYAQTYIRSENLGDGLYIPLETELRHLLCLKTWKPMLDHLSGELWDRLNNLLYMKLREPMWQLQDRIAEQLWVEMHRDFGTHAKTPDFLSGSHDLFWIAYYKFSEHIGVRFDTDTSRRLEIMGKIGHQCEWWWPFENVCVASRRAKTQWKDGRMHSATGPAIEYQDGFSVYCWEGRRVSREGWEMSVSRSS